MLVLVCANFPWAENYADLWQTKLTVGLSGIEEAVTLRAQRPQETTLICMGRDAARFVCRSGSPPFAPDRAGDPQEQHRGTGEHQGPRHLAEHQIP